MDHDTHTAMQRRQSRRETGRRSWQRTGLVLLAGFLIWLVLDATVLQYNSYHRSPPGARRTAALDILDPIAQLAKALHLDAPVAAANEALGRTGEGGFTYPPLPPPTTVPKGATTTTIPPRVPTARHRLHVLIVGDSLGGDLAYPLQSDLTATGVVAVNVNWVVSTGLTRLDYYNWIRELKGLIYEDHPQLIIGMMGANDATGMVAPPLQFNTKPWRAQYERNVATFFSIAKQDGRQVLWVSVPIIQDKGRNLEFQVVRDLQQKEARIHHAVYFDSDSVLSPHGTYAAYLRVGGQLALVRTPSDGIHLTPAGGALLASAVMTAIAQDLHIRLR
jgi:lysophospholipase L1-like esterase